MMELQPREQRQSFVGSNVRRQQRPPQMQKASRFAITSTCLKKIRSKQPSTPRKLLLQRFVPNISSQNLKALFDLLIDGLMKLP